MNISDRGKTILAGAIISLSTLLAYWNIRNNNLIGYDDVKYLIENEHVRSGLSLNSIKWALTATYDANWFPLTWLSHMLDMSLFGSNHLGHHLENLCFHITNALLLMSIFHRLTGRLWRSTVVALLFALHPSHVESVVWAAERKDVLSTLFFLLTIKVYISYTTRRTGLLYWSAILLYLCGLASKAMLVSLPFVLLLLDYWPLRRITIDNKFGFRNHLRNAIPLLREKIPFALLSVASCIVTLFIQRNGGAINDTIFPHLWENSLHALYNYMTYLRMTFWPVNLGALYPYVHDIPVWMMFGAGCILLGISMLAVKAGKSKPYIGVGWLWFVITTAPVAGFVRIGAHSVADRYTYIPSIGIFIVLVWLASDFLHGRACAKAASLLLTAAITIPLAAATWQQTTYWKDSITLFEHTLSVTSNNWVAHGNLGAELLKYNRPRQAIWHLQEAVRINPDSDTALFNLGLALNCQGNKSGAISAFHNAIRLNPSFTNAYFEAGKTCYEIGDKETAQEFQAALTKLDKEMADSLRRYSILLEHTHVAGSSSGL